MIDRTWLITPELRLRYVLIWHERGLCKSATAHPPRCTLRILLHRISRIDTRIRHADVIANADTPYIHSILACVLVSVNVYKFSDRLLLFCIVDLWCALFMMGYWMLYRWWFAKCCWIVWCTICTWILK